MIEANDRVGGTGTESSHSDLVPAEYIVGQEEIAEFQQLVAEETGVALPEGDARTRATELIALVRILHGRIPEDR